MSTSSRKLRVTFLPLYSEAELFLQVFDEKRQDETARLMADIEAHRGTPQEPADWSEPDRWIPERLSGRSAELAMELWTRSEKSFNPRYMVDAQRFVTAYELIGPDGAGVLRMSPRGRAFVAGDGEVLRFLDEHEGILELLAVLERKGPCRRKLISPDWERFAAEVSSGSSVSIYRAALSRRLRNVLARGLVEREGIVYSLTDAGRAGLGSGTAPGTSPRRQLAAQVRAFNDERRGELREALAVMDPFLFEHLVRDLLEAMGYEDVRVTKERGDKGVDVVALVQFGITTIREVVQVKRVRGAIGRPVLDQLRGALPYHDALRGTIVTTGSFSKGCTEAALHPGAAPITLIDGETLLDMLIEHEIGLRRSVETVLEFDVSRFFPDREVPPVPDEDEIPSASIAPKP